MTRRVPGTAGLLLGWAALAAGCGGAAEPPPPNVLWVVWDTVRADRMSLYGQARETTPYLEEWARDATVFEDCRSVASSTVPSHGSMFTGLMPSEHGADNRTRHLDPRFTTVAEVFQDAGYGTYLFSANPNIQRAERFDQGFDVEEHPWDAAYRDAALAILRAKTEGDRASSLPHAIANGTVADFDLKACGMLANEGFDAFLADAAGDRPFFAFLNYMEAHEPLIPPRELRDALLTPEQVAASYEQDRSWRLGWQLTYGLREQPPEYFELMAAVYDVALLELDGLFRDLIQRLEAAGHAEDTIVILTSDHGEHLGEHGMVGHRYSLYDDVLRVPLVVRVPGRAGGRSDAPVSNVDLFQTVLNLAGLEAPVEQRGRSLDLFDVEAQRVRLAEYPGDFPIYLQGERPEGFDEARWTRRMRALFAGDKKLIWASDARHELYALGADPTESTDLVAAEPATVAELMDELETRMRALRRFVPGEHAADEELIRQLQSIGY